MMRSSRFPDDTLFFIFEEDFEFTDSNSERQRVALARELSAHPPEKKKPRLRSPDRPPKHLAHLQPLRRHVSLEVAGPKTYAEDLVTMVNVAHRAGHGDLVWLGYQPTKHATKEDFSYPKIGFGSQLIAVTKAAAASIERTFNCPLWKPGHIDMELLKWCRDIRWSSDKASFIWPPVGSYHTHASECCPKEGIREDCWKYSWACPGTRPQHDPRNRTKRLWTFSTAKNDRQKQVGPELTAVAFDQPKLTRWLCFRAPECEMWPAPSTERERRSRRKQVKCHDEYRHWVTDEKEVAH